MRQNKKTLAIVILSVTATLLLMANSFTAHRADAFSVKDRDYQIVTVQSVVGGQALYIADNRTGQIAVFTWDPTAKGLKVRDRQALGDLMEPK